MTGIFYLLGAGLLIVADYLAKQWMTVFLQPVTQIHLIPNVFSLYYHQNYGAAFGILQQKTGFLIVVTGVVLLALVVAILLKKIQGHLLLASFSLIIAGGFGNLIDRVRLGYVVDYLYFEPINFPIFNLADCCVVVGTGLLIIYILVIETKNKKNLPEKDGDV